MRVKSLLRKFDNPDKPNMTSVYLIVYLTLTYPFYASHNKFLGSDGTNMKIGFSDPKNLLNDIHIVFINKFTLLVLSQ